MSPLLACVVTWCVVVAADPVPPASDPPPATPEPAPSTSESAPAGGPSPAPSPSPSEAAGIETSPSGSGYISPTDPLPPTGINEELELIRPGVAIQKKLNEFADKTGFRFGMANTLLFQQATGGPGDRTAAGGDLDIYAKWTLIGRGTKDTGMLAASGEYRYQMGSQPPASLGPEIGTLTATTNGFSERTMVLKEMYWDQRLFEDRFRIVAGRVDPENLFGGHRLQSANLYFLNKAFSSNPTIAFPGSGFAAAAQIKPVPWLYIDGGITDGNGQTTMGNFEGFWTEGDYLLFTEGALTPTIEGLGTGRYRVALWHIDKETGDEDGGVTVSLDQDFGEDWIAFLRYGHADGELTNITDSVQGGFGVDDLALDGSLVGFAVAWSKPEDDELRDEKVAEIFWRFQLTQVAQLMVGTQVIFDPSNAPEDDVLGVFSVRLRVAF